MSEESDAVLDRFVVPSKVGVLDREHYERNLPSLRERVERLVEQYGADEIYMIRLAADPQHRGSVSLTVTLWHTRIIVHKDRMDVLGVGAKSTFGQPS